MEYRLNSKIKSLYEIAEKYYELIKKDHAYQYRFDAIYLQINVLEELRSGVNEIERKWMECYMEDLQEFELSN